MHDTARRSADDFYNRFVKSRVGPTMLDVGSFDVNGSLRDSFPGVEYTGMDQVTGKNVDVVNDNLFFPFDECSFDFVVSSSCFEHDRFFWVTIAEMFRVVKYGGYVYLNAPSTGPHHSYPIDAWRFYADAGKALAEWGQHMRMPISLVESRITPNGEFRDFVAIFRKEVEND